MSAPREPRHGECWKDRHGRHACVRHVVHEYGDTFVMCTRHVRSEGSGLIVWWVRAASGTLCRNHNPPRVLRRRP
jgi:hypothetical protein